MALVPGGERGSWKPVLLGENVHLELGHRHSGNNNVADQAAPERMKSHSFGLVHTTLKVS